MDRYTKTTWQDHFVDEHGNVIQQGTPVNAQALNNIENGIVKHDEILLDGMSEAELDAMLEEVLV